MREQRDIATRLRPEDPPGGDVLVIRGGLTPSPISTIPASPWLIVAPR
jgi:hypothetical protein